jgi:hypothetical protein
LSDLIHAQLSLSLGPIGPGFKACSKCGQSKHQSVFYRNRPDCITCNRRRQARYRSRPEVRRRAVERAREWQRRNRERYLENQRAYKEKNRARIQGENRERHLRQTYGLTPEQYDAMNSAQNGLCAICSRSEIGGLHIDHDHRTGSVRGLLCGRCNKAIGLFDDDPYRIQAAGIYLLSARTKNSEGQEPDLE